MKRIILPNGDILFLSAITKITKIKEMSHHPNSFFEIHYNGGSYTITYTKIKTKMIYFGLKVFLDDKKLVLDLEDND